jgi:hypothetical protein
MVNKLILFINTIKHLKAIQVYYQLYYKLLPKTYIKPIAKVTNFNLCSLRFLEHSNSNKIWNGNEVVFLNLSKRFEKNIDWSYNEYGKLWNYNLQYFDYLSQEDLGTDEKMELLNSFYEFSVKNKIILEPYPVSLRIINCIKFFNKEEIIDKSLHNYLYQELTFLNNNFEYHILGNHLLENAFALLMGGAYFQNKKWINQGQIILLKEIEEQILEDGAHFELSPMYHNIIFFRVLELIHWFSFFKDKEDDFLKFLKLKAVLMRTWLEQIAFKNGDLPNFNDCAEGIALPVAELLSFADKLNLVSNSTLLGASGYRSISKYIYECKIDVAQLGPKYQPGHSHADALSFIVYHNSKPLFVEKGTSTYEINERRHEERATSAHNTVSIGNENQSQVWSGFRVGNRAETNIIKDSPDSLIGSHNGYFNTVGMHKRKFTFFENHVTIEDLLQNNNYKALFHLHVYPNEILLKDGNTIIIKDRAKVTFKNAENISIENYTMATGFNRCEMGQKIIVEFQDNLKTRIDFI